MPSAFHISYLYLSVNRLYVVWSPENSSTQIVPQAVQIVSYFSIWSHLYIKFIMCSFFQAWAHPSFNGIHWLIFYTQGFSPQITKPPQRELFTSEHLSASLNLPELWEVPAISPQYVSGSAKSVDRSSFSCRVPLLPFHLWTKGKLHFCTNIRDHIILQSLPVLVNLVPQRLDFP